MPDISPMLIRICLRAGAAGAQSCGECRRTPLAGEGIHRLDSGRVLCDLCLAALPEDRRTPVRSDRVGASERPLVVAPRAA